MAFKKGCTTKVELLKDELAKYLCVAGFHTHPHTHNVRLVKLSLIV